MPDGGPPRMPLSTNHHRIRPTKLRTNLSIVLQIPSGILSSLGVRHLTAQSSRGYFRNCHDRDLEAHDENEDALCRGGFGPCARRLAPRSKAPPVTDGAAKDRLASPAQ